MKKVFFFLTVVILNFTFLKTVFASEEYLVKVRDTTLSVYKSTTSSTILETLEADTIHTLLSYEKDGNYYKITTSSGVTGYVNSNSVVAFIDLSSNLEEDTLSCITNLKEAGFSDETYYPYLCLIQKQHPTWIFKAIDTELDWEASVAAESSCTSSVKSYIPLYDSQLDYYSNYINKSCKNEYSSYWYPASALAVSYHMDPRNFLSENFLFQFEKLTYDEDMSTLYVDIVRNIILNASFYTSNLAKGNDIAEFINAASKKENINPTFLASRILQEMGSGTTLEGLYSGEYAGYVGYYNFVNWSVSDSCATSSGSVVCGLEYAVKAGWEGVLVALEGAAYNIGENYIAVGQYTTYLQKFNVVPSKLSNLYTHQYQTNIEAPSSEAWSTFNSYSNSDDLDNVFVFAIPVYDDMPVLTEGLFTSNESEDDDEIKLSVKEIVTESGYDYSSNYISGFKVSENVSDIIKNIEKVAGTGNITIKNSEGVSITTGIIKTGYSVVIKGSNVETLGAVLYGDTSGDGEINALDLLQVQKYILGLYTLSGMHKEAGDTSSDEEVNALDLLQIQKNILNLYEIEQ